MESNVGDIGQIWKVIEKRLQQEDYTQLSNDERQAITLIDRFKFMDLYPCTNEELRSLGYQFPMSDLTFLNLPSKETTKLPETIIKPKTLSPTSISIIKKDIILDTTSSIIANYPSVLNSNSEAVPSMNPFNKKKVTRPKFSTPDTSKMYAYKPIENALCNLQPIPGGGTLLLPQFFSDLIKRLPPPHCFNVIFENKHYLTLIEMQKLLKIN